MDTGDLRILDRVQTLEIKVSVLEGWRTSLKQDLENVAKHSLEVDEKCEKMQEYLDNRKKASERQSTLIQDIKKWLVILVAGWFLMVFLDGAKLSVNEWLKPSGSGQRAP